MRIEPLCSLTLSETCGMPSAPFASRVGKRLWSSGLMGSTERSSETLVVETSAIELGVLGMNWWRSFWRVEKFLQGSDSKKRGLPVVIDHLKVRVCGDYYYLFIVS